jgi:predicted TIM-barrel fold metal-dependent hydrolase
MIGKRHDKGISRRDTLLMTVALAALSSRWGSSSASVPQIDVSVPRCFIDAHCHVFNAHDIPMKQFIIETAVRESPDLRPWVGVASLLSWFIRLWVDITDNEVSLVEYPSARPTTPTREFEDNQFRGLVSGSVKRVSAEAAGGAAAMRAEENDPFAEMVIRYGKQRAPDLFEVKTRSAPLPLNLSAVSMNYLLGKYQLAGLKHAETGTLLRELRDEDLRATVPLRTEDENLRSLADSIVRDAQTQSTDVGSIMNLARIISRQRLRNIEVLDESLGVAAASPTVTRLYVPALVDFDCWYGKSGSSLAMFKQTSIMGKLSKKQKDPNRFANGYVPLDPLRAVLVQNGVIPDLRSPIEVVTTAIEQQGFLGAKLYPPMGFRPWFNSELRNEDFGDKVKPWIEQLKLKTKNSDFQLGPALDAELMKLYSYCLMNDVPVMAHCSNSQTSFTGSGERASPEYWLRLLDRSDPASGIPLTKLRLNLGHFGSIWCHERADVQDPNADSETERCHVAYSWPEFIVRAISPGENGEVRYPNLYFDLGDLGTITENPKAGSWLRMLLESRTEPERRAILSRMVYGTDWMFLVLFGKPHVNYINSVYDLVSEWPGASAKIFHENAARFLGLTKDGRTAERMRAFYADDGNRLERFQSLLV